MTVVCKGNGVVELEFVVVDDVEMMTGGVDNLLEVTYLWLRQVNIDPFMNHMRFRIENQRVHCLYLNIYNSILSGKEKKKVKSNNKAHTRVFPTSLVAEEKSNILYNYPEYINYLTNGLKISKPVFFC